MLDLKLGFINSLTFLFLLIFIKYGYGVTEMVFSKEVDITKAKPYEILTFILFYSNSGDNYATNVTVIDYLPNHTQYLEDSAETNNQLHNGTATIQYWALNTWHLSNYDNTNGNVSNVLKIKWFLNSNVQPEEYGFLSFKVLVK